MLFAATLAAWQTEKTEGAAVSSVRDGQPTEPATSPPSVALASLAVPS
jgi:hypothetical protein